ncbi:hypothetical protein GH721_12995 [Kriegella sp. EG-1]|nr:hypothetical protein [Flavobacteriaceae bacterium EG-1]
MKTIIKFITSNLLIMVLLMTSCQKEENKINIDDSLEEGFTSKTGNNDSELNNTQEFLIPLLHRQYNSSLSKEEATSKFNEAITKFEKENGNANKSASYFYFDVQTRTSNYNHSQTDGSVWARFNFVTDKGNLNLPWTRLNNEGNDRENGAWDFYHFRTHVSSINWLEAKSATLALRGTDGWHVKYFDTRVYSWDQFSSATGNTRAISNPEIWLDNNTSTGWDYYNTGNVGTGRTTFN